MYVFVCVTMPWISESETWSHCLSLQGVNILADFAVKYAKTPMGVDIQELYTALVSDATNNSVEWNNGGRQIGVYEKYGYIPFAVYDLETTGRQTREGSRTLE